MYFQIDERILYRKLAFDVERSEQHIRNIIHRKNDSRPSTSLAEKLEKLVPTVSKETWLFGSTAEIIKGLRNGYNSPKGI